MHRLSPCLYKLNILINDIVDNVQCLILDMINIADRKEMHYSGIATRERAAI